MGGYKTNHEIGEFMLHKIYELGYKPYNIEWINELHGENSCVYFRLRGLGFLGNHWKFGMWLNEEWQYEENRNAYEKKYGAQKMWNIIQIFCQYDTMINKFKPSCSPFCVKYTFYELKKIENEYYINSWSKLEDMLNMIEHHPLLSYNIDSYGYKREYYPESFLWEFIKSEGKRKWIQIKKFFMSIVYIPYIKIKLWLARKDSIIKEVTFTKSEYSGADYQIKVIFMQAATDEQMVAWLDKWFKRDRYGEYDTYDCVVELENCFHQEGHEKGFTFW